MGKYFLDIWYYIKWVKASCMHSIYIHNFIKLKFQAGKDLGLCWLNAVCLIVTVHPMFHTVDKDPNPNERLVKYILAECQVPKCVAEFFVKCRLQHRIKILNKKRIQFRRDIRSLKQIGQFQN